MSKEHTLKLEAITPRHGYPIIIDESGRTIVKFDCSITHTPHGWVKNLGEAQKYAALIVRAVNSHEAMKEALEMVLNHGTTTPLDFKQWEQVHAALELAKKGSNE